MKKRDWWIVGGGVAAAIASRFLRFAYWWIVGVIAIGYGVYAYVKGR